MSWRNRDPMRNLYNQKLGLWFTHEEAASYINTLKRHHGDYVVITEDMVPCPMLRGVGLCRCFDDEGNPIPQDPNAIWEQPSPVPPTPERLERRQMYASPDGGVKLSSGTKTPGSLKRTLSSASQGLKRACSISADKSVEFAKQMARLSKFYPSTHLREDVIKDPPPQMSPLCCSGTPYAYPGKSGKMKFVRSAVEDNPFVGNMSKSRKGKERMAVADEERERQERHDAFLERLYPEKGGRTPVRRNLKEAFEKASRGVRHMKHNLRPRRKEALGD